MDDNPNLGSCCVCGKYDPDVWVRNIIMLDRPAPIPGRGWGCFRCDLPDNGAVAVVCDNCLTQPLVFACRGYPAKDGRVLYESLTGTFGHDMSKHPEAMDDYGNFTDE